MGIVSTSAAHADAFYREVIEHGTVWSIKDSDGFPAPQTSDGRSMPFWSLKSRAERVVGNVPAYSDFEVVPIPLVEWRERWLPDLGRDGVRAGLNWSGTSATGYDVDPEVAERNLAARQS
jgi:hypothetical protein